MQVQQSDRIPVSAFAEQLQYEPEQEPLERKSRSMIHTTLHSLHAGAVLKIAYKASSGPDCLVMLAIVPSVAHRVDTSASCLSMLCKVKPAVCKLRACV